jgi:hypothetical protein
MAEQQGGLEAPDTQSKAEFAADNIKALSEISAVRYDLRPFAQYGL